MRPSFASAAAALALAISLFAVVLALTGSLDPGVMTDAGGRVIEKVDPHGFAWAAGVRPGQHVLLLQSADAPGGWVLETTDGRQSFRVSGAGADQALRLSAPATLVGVMLAILAFAAVRIRRRRAELLAALALVFAVVPFAVTDQRPIGLGLLVLAGLGPPVWIVRWQRLRTWVAAGVLGFAALLASAWAILAAADAPAAGPVGEVARIAGVVGILAMLAIGIGVTPARVLQTIASTRVLDAAVLAAGAIAGTGLAVLGLPLPLVMAIVLLPMLGYVLTRSAVARAVDRLLLAELREREAIRATEEERARMSREIHDDPLQALAGVIQQLEDPDADRAAARTSLREVADRLRSVATDLHPPVLDDLGLAPAIEAAARTLGPGVIEVRLANTSGYRRAERPPADVELAVYRIVHEALANAVHHSGAERVGVAGEVAVRRISIEVRDTGTGISEERIEQALRSGHLGLASMRRRADAIDAHLEIVGEPGVGTRVSLRWPG